MSSCIDVIHIVHIGTLNNNRPEHFNQARETGILTENRTTKDYMVYNKLIRIALIFAFYVLKLIPSLYL